MRSLKLPMFDENLVSHKYRLRVPELTREEVHATMRFYSMSGMFFMLPGEERPARLLRTRRHALVFCAGTRAACSWLTSCAVVLSQTPAKLTHSRLSTSGCSLPVSSANSTAPRISLRPRRPTTTRPDRRMHTSTGSSRSRVESHTQKQGRVESVSVTQMSRAMTHVLADVLNVPVVLLSSTDSELVFLYLY